MKINNFYFIIFFLFIISCQNNDNIQSTSYKPTPGSITGFVLLYNTETNSFLSKNHDVLVKIKGTEKFDSTDINGSWTLKDIEPGIYNIVFSKLGFDTLEVFRFELNSNSTSWAGFDTLYKIPEGKVENFHVSSVDTNYIKDTLGYRYELANRLGIWGIINQKGINYTLLFHTNQNISKYKGNYTKKINLKYEYDSINNRFHKIGYVNWIDLQKDFRKGEVVYVVAYIGNYVENKDDRSEVVRLMGLSQPSNIVSFVMP